MPKENIVYVNKDTLEIEAMRTEFSKTFYVTDTERRLVSSRSPLHVKDKKGKWVDITCEIKNNKPINCPYKATMLKDKIGYKVDYGKGRIIEMEILDLPYKQPKTENNTAIWEDIIKDMDVVLSFEPNFIKLLRILKSKDAKETINYKIVLNEKAADHIEFIGHDAENKVVHLEQKEISSKSVKRKGRKLVEKVISDTFIPEVTEMDPKTRKRYWSKNVKYPVVIH